MKKSFTFDLATQEDLGRIAEIEDEFFGDYDRKFTSDFLERWYAYNPNMIYVIRDSVGIVQAFTILVPVSANLYDRLLLGEVSDFFEFDEKDVINSLGSPYYYLADICVSKSAKSYLRIAGALMFGAAKVLYSYAKRITTSPVTKDGYKLCEHMGFKEVSRQVIDGVEYPIYELRVPNKGDELPKMFRMIYNKGE